VTATLAEIVGAGVENGLVPTPILGRADEIAQLTEHLGLAAPEGSPPSGAGQAAVLLGGEAGVGKTRMLLELADRARSHGWRVLVGHCLDLADSLLPYLPFSELVGRYVDEDPDGARRIAETYPALAALAPGRRLMSGAGSPSKELSVDRAELFDAMHAFVDSVSADAPVLLVVEDLHWADQSTRDLLSFLFARPFRGRVAVVASYRTDDLHRRHPLRAALAGWVRLPGVERVVLPPLADTAVRRLVRTLRTESVPERDVAWIVARAEGNAFFAEELVGASQLGERGVPDDLADLLLVRLDRLDDDARLVVRAASCSGRRVSHELLAAVVDLPPDKLDHALRGAVEHNVLVQVGADGYSFRHALLAEAVHGDLLPGERVRLHGKYAEALLAGTVDGTAAELATHARAAHDTDTAVRASIRAGDEAMAVGGPDDAATHYEAALEMVSRPGIKPPEDVDVVGLIWSTSEAVIATGHPARALALVRDHLASAASDLSTTDRVRLLLAQAAAALLNETTDEPVDLTSEALELVGDEPSRLRAGALSIHARALHNGNHHEEAAQFASQALALAERFELPEIVTEAATTLAAVDDKVGDADAALKALEDTADTARATGDTVGEMRSRYYQGFINLERGRLAEAQELFRATSEAATAAGRPWAPYGFDARYHQAMTAMLRGHWEEALAVADTAGQSPPTDPEALLVTVRMLVGAGRGDQSVLGSYERFRSSWPREGVIALNSGAAAIELLGQAGDLEGVRRVHAEVVDFLSSLWSPLFLGQVRLVTLVLDQLSRAVPTAPTHERDQLVAFARELDGTVHAVIERASKRRRTFGPEGQAWAARFHAELLRLSWLAGGDEAPDSGDLVEAWQAAVATFDELGHPYEAARSRTRLAAVLAAGGRAAEAEPLVATAREVATGLRAEPLLAEIRAVGTGRVRRTTGGPATTELTAREREILALVAEGRTNGDIGKQLFISTKTVSVHVSNILAKLGAGGRTEAAAIARRTGLLD
jgi:DNA-binding CsgD family transcriptional regulator/tetratricopeptide (TPR) repeat protein